MVHRTTPHTVTKYSPYYLLHGREMRLPTTDGLSARIDTDGAESKSGNPVEDHARVLAERLKEAYEVVQEHNRIGREKQKIQYNKNTKLITFSEGEYVYLKEMAIGAGKSKKFRDRWRGPYQITKKLSDWNYKIRFKPGKTIVVNVNQVKRCHDPPIRRRLLTKTTEDQNNVLSDNEPDEYDSDSSDKVVWSQPLPLASRNIQEENFDNRDKTMDETIELGDTVHDPTWRPGQPNQGRPSDENCQDPTCDGPRYYLRSQDRQQSEPQTSGEPQQAIATPEVQTDPTQDELVPDNGLNQETNPDRNLPYPYLL